MDAVRAFIKGKNYKSKNTEVWCDSLGVTIMLLYGQKIAYKDNLGVFVNFCGYPTLTTKRRINGILEGLGIKARFNTVNATLQLRREGQKARRVSTKQDIFFEVPHE